MNKKDIYSEIAEIAKHLYDEIMKYFLQKYPDEGTIEKETPPVIATEAGM